MVQFYPSQDGAWRLQASDSFEVSGVLRELLAAPQLPLYLQRRLLMQRVDRLKAGQTSSFSLHPRIHCVRWWKFHRRCTGLPWIPDEDAPDHFTQLSWNIMFYPPCIQLASRYDSLNWIKHTNMHELDVFGNWVKQFSREIIINTHKLKDSFFQWG